MFELLQGTERALLVQIDEGDSGGVEGPEELSALANAAAVEVCGMVCCHLQNHHPKYLIGQGKADEIRLAAVATEAQLVLFNAVLSPAQHRNLERFLERPVLDRTGLILQIFAQRARTFEGKLQVERAQLQYLSTRLVNSWTHLERQRGGIGVRGGPGEKQLEIDRRLLGKRIKVVDQRLERVRNQRAQSRRGRQRTEVPVVGLVGYTNAGKSTLFNRLTGAQVYAADQLFATLDPTLRRVVIPGFGPAVISDTVGFIQQLPHDLIAAFRATLEEIREVNLLLHVIDASSSQREQRIIEVEQVLADVGADHIPRIEVYNKLDCMEMVVPQLQYDEANRVKQVWLSAKTGAGITLLWEALAQCLGDSATSYTVKLPLTAGKIRAKLYALDAVVGETMDAQGGWILEVRLSKSRLRQVYGGESPEWASLKIS